MSVADVKGDSVLDLEELKILNTQLPALLFPAYRVKQKVVGLLGERWHRHKLQQVLSMRDNAQQQALKMAHWRQRERQRQLKLFRVLGCWRYVTKPELRHKFDDFFPPEPCPDSTEDKHPTRAPPTPTSPSSPKPVPTPDPIIIASPPSSPTGAAKVRYSAGGTRKQLSPPPSPAARTPRMSAMHA